MFIFSEKSPITFSDSLPDKVDVVVIGGGVIGISTAWYLLQQGHSVLVCDKGRIAGEQSSRNWGWVRVTARDPDEVPIAIDSVKCWEDISQSLDEDIGFTRQGVLLLADSEKEMAEFEEWRKFAGQHDLHTTLFSRSEIASHIDVPSHPWQGGMVTPSDGRAEPFKAVPAIARGVQSRGGLIREACAVRTIDVEAGRIAGVVTEAGRVKTQAVLCAAGVWSTIFLSNMEISLPQLAVRATVARTEKAPKIFGGAAELKDIFFRRRQDGGYTVATGFAEHTIGANSFRYMFKFFPTLRSGGNIGIRAGRDMTQQAFPAKKWSADDTCLFESNRVLNPAPSAKELRKIRRNLDKRIPQLSGVGFAEAWAGMIDAMPDIVPVMDQISSCPGLFLATGFSGHGFGIGPGAGKLMADLIAGETPTHDIARFRFSRFSDGSKIRPGPEL